jgi:hypothetical protein
VHKGMVKGEGAEERKMEGSLILNEVIGEKCGEDKVERGRQEEGWTMEG